MLINYNSPDDIDMLFDMCTRFPCLRTLVLFGSHTKFSESLEEISELLEAACFRYDGKVRIRKCYDALTAEFENGSLITVTVAREGVRGLRAHIVEYETCIEDDILHNVVRPIAREYDIIHYKEKPAR